ncbi:MAG: response regulator [Candidatus Methylomirabilota bacterium]|jgi:two-component system NtrC family response regulator
MVDILVVDDEKDICWALENALGDEGYHITQVNRGEDAIREVKQRSFDMAIVDVKLPGMSGLEVSRLIGQLDPRLKILMISGYHYEEDQPIQEGIRQRMYRGFISKPFELDEVSALVRRVLAEDDSSPARTGGG